MPTPPNIARIDQYRAELRQAIQAGVWGHEATAADGIDLSFAFQGCVNMLYRAAVETSDGGLDGALQHMAAVASEAMIMLAVGEDASVVPGLSPEERASMSEEAVRRQTQSLGEEYTHSRTTVANMLALHETSHIRNDGPMQAWDLLRAYVAENARTMTNEGVGHDVVVERLSGYVAAALLVAMQVDRHD